MLLVNGQPISVYYKDVLVCQGLISSTKKHNTQQSVNLCSVDNIHYFNAEHPDIKVEFKNNNDLEYVLNIDNIPKVEWYKALKYPNQPLYVEVGIDQECVRLINAMNNIGHIMTIGSCCGHYKEYFWIDFIAESLISLRLLVKLFSFEGRFKEDWIIRTSKDIAVDCIKQGVPLSLVCNYKGQKAYRCAEELAEYLEQYSGLLSEG